MSVRRTLKSENKTVHQKVVEWLWDCKIHSRASFLLILQFIYIDTDSKMVTLSEMLILLNKRGKKSCQKIYLAFVS